MSGQFFIALLNPGISLLLAFAFLMLWLNRREKTYVALAAVGYLITAAAFFIQDVGPVLPFELQRIPSNLCFLLAGCFLTAAVLWRYAIRPPYRLFAIIAAVGMAGQVWFLLVQPSLTNRIYAVSFALGAMAIVTAIKLYAAHKPRMIDKLLFGISVLSAANFIVRPVVVIWLVGSQDGSEDFQQSVYWTTVQFTQALISIMIALNLMVAVATDLMDELKAEANTDRLSGLLNRRGFEDEALAALQRCRRQGVAVSLLIADLDHFKAINDTHGHAVGDQVIATFGQLLKRSAGPDMTAGRIGGEEFAVLMSAADLAAARIFAEDVRAALTLSARDRLPSGLEPTVSIGLGTTRKDYELYNLLRDADAALYTAKRAGRDRVHVNVQSPALVPRSFGQS